jgi:acyl carrier protein
VDVLARVTDVFRDVFETDELTIERGTTAKDVSGWDSLMHVRLVIAIEKAFKIRFSSSEVAGFGNVGDLIDSIERKTGSQTA